ncbi:hypothetical protein [Salegentibacter chungangensis]|uniref:Prenyltransferase n=1 Tax=Salegentibacter chungangensis TaxID=1335724 RepID=A0ABW3NVH0_9FLAO
MKFLEKVLGLYISSSIHVALAVVSLSLISLLEFGLAIDINLLAFIFLATITGYNFVKYSGVAKLHHISLTRNLRFIQVFSLICFLLLVYFSFLQEAEVIYVAITMGLLTAFYTLPILKGGLNLRNLEGVKIFIIAFVWAGTTAVMPLITENVAAADVILIFFQRLLFIVALTLPFEIRDVRFDDVSLGTIPQQLGVKNTKRLGFILLAGMCFLEIFKSQFSVVNLWAMVLAALISGIFIKKARTHQHEYYSSLWVEAVPIYWLGIWLVIHYWI